MDSFSGTDASAQQLNATPAEEKHILEVDERQAAAGQVIQKTFDQHQQLQKAHEHQGAIGRAVEGADNGLNYHNSYNNVNKRIIQSETDANNLIWQIPNGGDGFNSGYKKVSGNNYDPNNPLLKDDQWGGEVADNAKGIKGYEKNQKIGTMVFGMFLVPGGYASGGATSNAWEDNTRSDGTHDFRAKDYLKTIGIAAAGFVAGALPFGEAFSAAGSFLSGVFRGAGDAGEVVGGAARGAGEFGEHTPPSILPPRGTGDVHPGNVPPRGTGEVPPRGANNVPPRGSGDVPPRGGETPPPPSPFRAVNNPKFTPAQQDAFDSAMKDIFNSSDPEKAAKNWALFGKGHPDKGGDNDVFQQIQLNLNNYKANPQAFEQANPGFTFGRGNTGATPPDTGTTPPATKTPPQQPPRNTPQPPPKMPEPTPNSFPSFETRPPAIKPPPEETVVPPTSGGETVPSGFTSNQQTTYDEALNAIFNSKDPDTAFWDWVGKGGNPGMGGDKGVFDALAQKWQEYMTNPAEFKANNPEFSFGKADVPEENTPPESTFTGKGKGKAEDPITAPENFSPVQKAQYDQLIKDLTGKPLDEQHEWIEMLEASGEYDPSVLWAIKNDGPTFPKPGQAFFEEPPSGSADTSNFQTPPTSPGTPTEFPPASVGEVVPPRGMVDVPPGLPPKVEPIPSPKTPPPVRNVNPENPDVNAGNFDAGFGNRGFDAPPPPRGEKPGPMGAEPPPQSFFSNFGNWGFKQSMQNIWKNLQTFFGNLGASFPKLGASFEQSWQNISRNWAKFKANFFGQKPQGEVPPEGGPETIPPSSFKAVNNPKFTAGQQNLYDNAMNQIFNSSNPQKEFLKWARLGKGHPDKGGDNDVFQQISNNVDLYKQNPQAFEQSNPEFTFGRGNTGAVPSDGGTAPPASKTPPPPPKTPLTRQDIINQTKAAFNAKMNPSVAPERWNARSLAELAKTNPDLAAQLAAENAKIPNLSVEEALLANKKTGLYFQDLLNKQVNKINLTPEEIKSITNWKAANFGTTDTDAINEINPYEVSFFIKNNPQLNLNPNEVQNFLVRNGFVHVTPDGHSSLRGFNLTMDQLVENYAGGVIQYLWSERGVQPPPSFFSR